MIAEATDFPIIERGSEVAAYRLDLPIAAGFILSTWRDGRRTAA